MRRWRPPEAVGVWRVRNRAAPRHACTSTPLALARPSGHPVYPLRDREGVSPLRPAQLGAKGTQRQRVHVPLEPPARAGASVRGGSGIGGGVAPGASKRAAVCVAQALLSRKNGMSITPLRAYLREECRVPGGRVGPHRLSPAGHDRRHRPPHSPTLPPSHWFRSDWMPGSSVEFIPIKLQMHTGPSES